MVINVWADWAVAVFLLSARLSSVLTFAPPFSMLNAPLRVRVLLAVGLSACLVSSGPVPDLIGMATGALVQSLCIELAIGLVMVFALQAAFGSLYFIGRVMDVQAGFGLAMIIDPATKGQSPLFGTLLALAAGMVFFSVNGHHDFLRLFAGLYDALPVGSLSVQMMPERAIAYMGTVFGLALAAGAAVLIVLFLLDIGIAFMSRTLPQMNVLLFGLQIKTVTSLLVLAACFGLLSPVLLRIQQTALRFIAEVFAQ
ncbi:flagellar biosynthetic protein FliR [Paraherbaspirillum soli]|uniref:Flagellar biosynthetic protein FliR n=1 Tax=Paraherbaspirillum soli TaxID=631222 RepID=A0ABW0ME35_9BURK